MPNTDTATRTPAEWEALAQTFEIEARDCRRRSYESFQNCDTDGFLSQWAADSMARLLDRKAEWARAHGTDTVRALFDLDGNVISTHERDGEYGSYFVLTDAGARKLGRRFVSESNARKDAARLKNNRKKGFTLGTVRVAGRFDNSGSSMTSVAPRFFPNVDDLKAGRFEIVDREISFAHLDD